MYKRTQPLIKESMVTGTGSHRFPPFFGNRSDIFLIIFKLKSFPISTTIDVEIDLYKITCRFERLHPRGEWNWQISCLHHSEAQERDRFRDIKNPKHFPAGACPMPRTPLEDFAFGVCLGNRSVFIQDPCLSHT